MKFLPLLLLLGTLVLSACGGDRPFVRPEPRGKIQPSTEHPGYWQWEDGETVLLLGGADNDNLFQAHNYEQQLNAIQEIGGNFVRCELHNRYDSDLPALRLDSVSGAYRLNDAYFTRLDGFLTAAENRGIVVQLQLFSLQDWVVETFPQSSFGLAWRDMEQPEVPVRRPIDTLVPPVVREMVYAISDGQTEGNVLLELQQAFVDRVLRISFSHGNVIYDLEYYWAISEGVGKYWKDYLYRAAARSNVTIYVGCKEDGEEDVRYAFNDYSVLTALPPGQLPDYNSSYGDIVHHARVSRTPDFPSPNGNVFAFHRALLMHSAATAYDRAPYGLGLSADARTSIRAIRTIERDVKFWDLTLDKDLLVEIPYGALAARTEEGTTLIYLSGEDEVSIRLPAGNSGSHRVSVIGYLGTRRSERLDPPYDSILTLRSNEPRGGWLLLEPLPEN